MPLKMYNKEADKPLQGVKHIIAIAAGKGGVGKSSVTVNLAHALKHLGYSVGIMDTDIYGPSVRKMLPEEEPPTQKGPVIYPAQCQGIRMISMAYFRKESEAVVIRAPIANGIINQFINNVSWGSLDFLLIDFPPGTGDIQLTLCQQARLTGAIVVTTPQEVSVMDVKKAIHMFDQVKVPILGVVENMSYYEHKPSQEKIYIFGKGGGEKLAKDAGVPFLAGIPIDPDICRRGDSGQPLLTKEKSSTAQAFLSLAEQVAAQAEELKKSAGSCLQGFELTWKEMGN